MVIAAGSYPAGRWFESDRRYHIFGMNTQRLMPKIRPLGQAVKTSPFHGGNTSSSLVGVTRKTTNFDRNLSFFSYIRLAASDMRKRVIFASQVICASRAED